MSIPKTMTLPLDAELIPNSFTSTVEMYLDFPPDICMRREDAYGRVIAHKGLDKNLSVPTS
jgi:hypothetical protein